VKNGEYLACGLPIVTPQGIGDYSDLIARNQVGVLLKALEPAAYHDVLTDLRSLLGDPHLRSRCRAIAEREVGLLQVVTPRYQRIYHELIGAPGDESALSGKAESEAGAKELPLTLR